MRSVLRFAATVSAALLIAGAPATQALPSSSFAPIAAPQDELAPTLARAVGHRGGGMHRGGAVAGGARGGAVVRGPHGGTAAVGGSRHYGGAYHGGAHRGGAYHGGGYRGGAYHGGAYRGGVYRGGGAWVRPYGWPVGGAIAAGAAIGFVTAATAAAWASAPPQPGLCWYYTDASQRNGFWDNCPR